MQKTGSALQFYDRHNSLGSQWGNIWQTDLASESRSSELAFSFGVPVFGVSICFAIIFGIGCHCTIASVNIVTIISPSQLELSQFTQIRTNPTRALIASYTEVSNMRVALVLEVTIFIIRINNFASAGFPISG